MAAATESRKNPLERILSLFANVEAGEGIAVLLMTANIFLILSAYYMLKVVREQLTIAGISIGDLSGAEVKAYLPGVMAVLLFGIVPLYGSIASRVSRTRLIAGTLSIVIAFLIGFAAWGRITGSGTAIGLSFYVFLGIVNVFLIAQFWSFANDIYDQAQGKRLFAIIAIGQSLGAVLGPQIAGIWSESVFLVVAGASGMLLASIALYFLVNKMIVGDQVTAEGEGPAEKPLEKGGSFKLIFTTRYLLLIALMILCTNVVNTTGEYILADAAETKAARLAPTETIVDHLALAMRDPKFDREVPEAWVSYFEGLPEEVLAAGPGAYVAAEVEAGRLELTDDYKGPISSVRGPIVGRFYGTFFSIVNLVGLLLQMFVVSRIFKYFGVRAALFVLPVVALGGYAAIALIGGLLVLRVAKTAENSLDYSLQNTVKQTLFLPTSRAAKYKAKAAIDTFFVRFGDVSSAGLVFVGLRVLGFSATSFAATNVVLAGVWIGLNVLIAREHKKIAAED